MHEYQTEDNYMMGMERIPYSKYGNKTVGKPIMLLSGVFTTSIVYVSHNKSLGKYSFDTRLLIIIYYILFTLSN